MSIGDRVHALRHDRRFTMEELGKKIGVGKGTIKKYESGIIKNVPSDKIEALAEALETTPEYLMGWTDSPKEQNQVSDFQINEITEPEKNLLLAYRAAEDTAQRYALEMLLAHPRADAQKNRA